MAPQSKSYFEFYKVTKEDSTEEKPYEVVDGKELKNAISIAEKDGLKFCLRIVNSKKSKEIKR